MLVTFVRREIFSQKSTFSLKENNMSKLMEIRYPCGNQKGPKIKTSYFDVYQDKEDRRLKFRVTADHLNDAICTDNDTGEQYIDATIASQAIIDEIVSHAGNTDVNISNFRFGATPAAKDLVGDGYRGIAMLAINHLKG